MRSAHLEPKDFRADYVHATAAGWYVIAGVLCAASLSPASIRSTSWTCSPPLISWRKEDRERGNGNLVHHPDFESISSSTSRSSTRTATSSAGSPAPAAAHVRITS